MTKLFVGGLPYSVTNDELKDMFTKFGAVLSATVIFDKFTGQSKGFGFVEMEDDATAQQAISELNESMLGDRKLGVSVARPREERPQNGGFNRGGGFGGGYNRDRQGGGRDSGRSGGGRRPY